MHQAVGRAKGCRPALLNYRRRRLGWVRAAKDRLVLDVSRLARGRV